MFSLCVNHKCKYTSSCLRYTPNTDKKEKYRPVTRFDGGKGCLGFIPVKKENSNV